MQRKEKKQLQDHPFLASDSEKGRKGTTACSKKKDDWYCKVNFSLSFLLLSFSLSPINEERRKPLKRPNLRLNGFTLPERPSAIGRYFLTPKTYHVKCCNI